jgi:hypothetical protein
MKTKIWTSLAITLAGSVAVLAKVAAPDSDTAQSQFVFSLLPRSFQKNPRVDLNVFTEVTASGRRWPAPNAERPTYFVAHITPLEVRGATRVIDSRNAPTSRALEKLVVGSLSARHYRPAAQDVEPAIALIVHWGAIANPALDGENQIYVGIQNGGEAYPEEITQKEEFINSSARGNALEWLPHVLSDQSRIDALIDRAKLIGGNKFAKEFNRVLIQEMEVRRAVYMANSASKAAASGAPSENIGDTKIFTIFEASGAQSFQSFSPLALFMARDMRTEQMVEELFSDSYYVIVSAFDHTSLLQKRPVLLWRTRMSLSAVGNSMKETLPILVNTGGEYFGRETKQSVSLGKRIKRGHSVDIGEAEVKGYIDPSDTEPASEESSTAK